MVMTASAFLRVAALGPADVQSVVMANDQTVPDDGLAARVTRSFPGVDVHVTGHEASDLLGIIVLLEGEALSALIPDVVVLSISGDAARLAGAGVDARTATDEVKHDLETAVALIRARLGSHILALNMSTVDPEDDTTSYAGLDEEPFALRAHRLDGMLIDISHELGISIVDVDRLLAERGAAPLVLGRSQYTEEAQGAICEEVVRILGDYGFFDERPLVAQIGAKDATS